MEIDTFQKVIGIISGLVAILGTLFGIWRDWPKVQERLQKSVGNQKSNVKVVSNPSPNQTDPILFLFQRGAILIFIGGVLFVLGIPLMFFIGSSFLPLFFAKAGLTICIGGLSFVGIGFFLSAFDKNNIDSIFSKVLFIFLTFGIVFYLIYFLITE